MVTTTVRQAVSASREHYREMQPLGIDWNKPPAGAQTGGIGYVCVSNNTAAIGKEKKTRGLVGTQVHRFSQPYLTDVAQLRETDVSKCCVIYCHSKVFMVQGTRLYNPICNLVDTWSVPLYVRVFVFVCVCFFLFIVGDLMVTSF